MAKQQKNRKSGIRIGKFRITPLGLILLAVIVILIVVCVVIFVGKPGQVGGGGFLSPTATPTPTPEPTATPEPTPEPTPTPEPEPRSATIRALGEIAIQDNLLAAAKTEDGGYDFSAMFSEISSSMGSADFTIADVEGALSSSAEASGGDLLVTPPELITNLKDCGVDLINLANDHALDAGWTGLQEAMDNCSAEGMLYVGAAKTKEERDATKIIDINGIKVGLLAYTEDVNVKNAEDTDAANFGLCFTNYKSNAADDVKQCRDEGAEIVIACVSWGQMFEREPNENQQTIAKALVNAGVDVIIGYNPHVVQQALWLEKPNDGGRTLCILSCGNFLSDQREQYRDSGVIFEFTLSEESYNSGIQVSAAQYIPTYVWRTDSEDEAGNVSYDYRTIAAGQWLENAPEGMNYTQESRLREVWAEAQSIIDPEVATVAKE